MLEESASQPNLVYVAVTTESYLLGSKVNEVGGLFVVSFYPEVVAQI